MLAFIDLEERVPPEHPLRSIKALAQRASVELPDVVDAMYAEVGRASIPPKRLLRAALLIALYSGRSERVFCEELDYNLLFRWFLDPDLLEPSFDSVRNTLCLAAGRVVSQSVAEWRVHWATPDRTTADQP